MLNKNECLLLKFIGIVKLVSRKVALVHWYCNYYYCLTPGPIKLSPSQTIKFSTCMTSFDVASFICLSVFATLPIFSVTSTLMKRRTGQRGSMLAFQQVHWS